MSNSIPSYWLSILAVQSVTYECDAMVEIITSICRERGYEVEADAYGNLYVTKGNAQFYPVLVAHLDTVHDLIKDGHPLTPIVSPCGDLITGFDFHNMRQSGIGGDDKCGIIAALETLDSLPAGKAFFALDEEHGCIGSRQANREFFDDASCLIQADRQKNRDFVTHICGQEISSPGFINAATPIMERYGYATTPHGGITDVGELVHNGTASVCAVNLSAGYYRPHMEDEFICVPNLRNVCALMLDLAKELGGEQWAFTPRVLKSDSFLDHDGEELEPPFNADFTSLDGRTRAGFLDPLPEGTDIEREISELCKNGNFEGACDVAEYYGLPLPKIY